METGLFKCLRASCSIQGNMITLARDFGFTFGRDADTYYGMHSLEAVAKRHLKHVLRGNVYRARAAGEHLEESADYNAEGIEHG